MAGCHYCMGAKYGMPMTGSKLENRTASLLLLDDYGAMKIVDSIGEGNSADSSYLMSHFCCTYRDTIQSILLEHMFQIKDNSAFITALFPLRQRILQQVRDVDSLTRSSAGAAQ